MYKIIADSGCDIFSVDGVNFESVPLTISTSERSFLDDINLNINEMVDYLLGYKGRSYTACPSVDAFLKAYECDADELYVITLTSKLSGTNNSANLAANIYKESHPNANIFILDSLSVGPEMRLLIDKIIELKTKGKTFEEVSSFMLDYSKSTRLFFAFKSLHNLVQNGRVSKLAATFASTLSISLYGTASEQGEIAPLGKARGERKVVSAFLEEMNKAGYKGGKVYVSHLQNENLAQLISSSIKEQYPNADVTTYEMRGLCAYYCEKGGVVISLETK